MSFYGMNRGMQHQPGMFHGMDRSNQHSPGDSSYFRGERPRGPGGFFRNVPFHGNYNGGNNNFGPDSEFVVMRKEDLQDTISHMVNNIAKQNNTVRPHLGWAGGPAFHNSRPGCSPSYNPRNPYMYPGPTRGRGGNFRPRVAAGLHGNGYNRPTPYTYDGRKFTPTRPKKKKRSAEDQSNIPEKKPKAPEANQTMKPNRTSNQRRSAWNTETGGFECPYCNIQFVDVANLNFHFQSLHPAAFPSDAVMDACYTWNVPKSKKNICIFCSYRNAKVKEKQMKLHLLCVHKKEIMEKGYTEPNVILKEVSDSKDAIEFIALYCRQKKVGEHYKNSMAGGTGYTELRIPGVEFVARTTYTQAEKKPLNESMLEVADKMKAHLLSLQEEIVSVNKAE